MKRIIALLMVFVSIVLYSVAFAEVTHDQLDNLTDTEKTTLKAQIEITLITRSAGVDHTSYSYSDILDIDLAELTTDELKEIQDYLDSKKDEANSGEDTLVGAELCSYKLLNITVDSAEIKQSKWNGMTELRLPVTIDNGNDFDYEGCVHIASINGWQVHPYCYFSIKAGLKAKEEIILDISGIGVNDLDDIESMTISFRLNYAYYSNISDEVTLTMK